MELVCEKYKERMDSAEAVCRRPGEYCKFRSSCMIHVLAREKKQEEKEKDRSAAEPNRE